MRLTSIELPGFGCLSHFSAEPGPGLNLFYGDNEAGKSTLQQAICAMLYGFHDGDRASAAENKRLERFRPWAGGLYRGVLGYELEDGSRFEVRRDFSSPDVVTQVIDAMLGLDVSGQFGRGRHGNVPFARKHLGMSRGVFQSCAFISQGEIFDLDKNASPGQIGDAIAALADSARRDVSAVKAIAALDAAAGKVGSDRARTADLPVARDNLRRARDELAAADEVRRALADKSRRLDELQLKTRQLKGQALRAEYSGHVAEAARLRDQLRKLDEVESLLARASARAEELRGFASVPPALRDQVIALRGQHDRASATLDRVRRERGALDAELDSDTRLEYEALRVSVGMFTDEQVRELEAVAYSPAVAGEARSESKGLTAAVVRALKAIGRAIVRAFGAVLGRKRATAVATPLEAQTPVVIPQADAIALLERHRRYLTLRPLVEKAAAIDSQIEAESASAALLEAQLRSLLGAASVETDSLEDALVAFEDVCRKREQHQKAEAAAEEAGRRRSIILSGRTREEIAESLAEHESAERRLLADYPKLQGTEAGRSPEQLARVAQNARAEQHAAEVEVTRLDEEVRVTLDRFHPRAEIEEEIARWGGEVARLEKARAALTLAKSAIEEAMTRVYRDFAPAVNTFLSEGIEAATDGRYHRAHVDPSTLRVSLLVPETGQVVTDPPVSHGTRTLLYVLMRIGLAQHMSAIGEPVPLVLDDPFVDVDSRRLERMLAFLLELSGRVQVLLFTKDREILAWFRENAVGQAHKLHAMSGALAATIL